MDFFIEKPVFDATTARASFSYRLGEHRFREILSFNSEIDTSIVATPVFAQTMDLVACILGVSYFKLKAPFQINAPELNLSPLQQKLILDIYENGLGEFYARNGLSRFGQIELQIKSCAPIQVPDFNLPEKALILIGGGKDSLVSVQLAETIGLDFTPFAVNPKGPILSSIDIIGRPPLFVTRTLDPEMLRLGSEPNFYNGHVPSTAINSAIASLAALLFGYDKIILSNERSASEANTIHDGRPVNHQHSKSYAFECLMQTTLADLTQGHLDYFSWLRPYSEARIAQMFARTTQFDSVFSSCNANFRQKAHKGQLWCGACPKCHFVFLIFAPFMKPERMRAIYGSNILENPEYLNSFRLLTGLAGQKPWECVGEILEAAASVYKLSKGKYWQDTAIISALGPEVAARYGRDQLDTAWNDLMTDSINNNIPSPLAKRLQNSKT